MIPNKFHFIFGLKENFGGKPFGIAHYIAIKSAILKNNPDEVYFYYKYEPDGEYWDKIKPYLNLTKVEPPKEIFNRPLTHIAHQADVLRLKFLNEIGGIYLDCDTVCVKPFTELLNYKTILGLQGLSDKQAEGLCNAVILAEKGSEFINLWIESYSTFRSTGRDEFWCEHSVKIPLQLAKENPNIITVVSHDSFHYPTYHDGHIQGLFEQNLKFPNAFCHHLWEQISWDKYLKNLNEEYIYNVDTTYNLLARDILKG